MLPCRIGNASVPRVALHSKNVYESVIAGMSLGSAGSRTKTTGISRRSPAFSVCFVKQKQSSFLKYRPGFGGP